MDARYIRSAVRYVSRLKNALAFKPRIMAACVIAVVVLVSMGASHRTKNFVVNAPDARLAAEVGEAAERFRHDLAVSWLGQPLRDWSSPCVTTVRVGENMGAGGATTFMFDRGEVYGWRMSIQGSHSRLLDSVLPHEITHALLATHFRRPLPRWADEGAATSVEHISERKKYYRMLHQFLRSNRGISFSQMFAMTEYPADVLPLYSQGFTLADFLIRQGGRQKYIAFLEDGLNSGHWPESIKRNYAWKNTAELQNGWLAWVAKGCPPLENNQNGSAGADQMLASNQQRSPRETSPVLLASSPKRLPRPQPNLIFRMPVSTPGQQPPISGKATVAVQKTLPVSSQSSRPQGVQKSRQVILEWRNR